jgi:hypothetical protein
MSNEPKYRDLSELRYIPSFDDNVVVKIDRASMAFAVLAGLFGILYFALAPAAMSTTTVVSDVKLDGYSCKMISAITRNVNPWPDAESGRLGLISAAALSNYRANADAAARTSFPFLIINGFAENSLFPIFNKMNPDIYLIYDNVLFDSYDNCLSAARSQTTCKWVKNPFALRNEWWFDPFSQNSVRLVMSVCHSQVACSSLNGKVSWPSGSGGTTGFFINSSHFANPQVGKCSNAANISTCTNINENCDGLTSLMVSFQDLYRKFILTPEVICKPFVDNPPYICTQEVRLNWASILSQALAFFTSALAAAKTALYLAVKMRHKCHNTHGKDDGGSGTNCEDKAQKAAGKPSDSSVEMQSLKKEPITLDSDARNERVESQIENQSYLLQYTQAEMQSTKAEISVLKTKLETILQLLQGEPSMQREPSTTRGVSDSQKARSSDVIYSVNKDIKQSRVVGALASSRSKAKSTAPMVQLGDGSSHVVQESHAISEQLEMHHAPPPLRARSSSRGRYAANDTLGLA